MQQYNTAGETFSNKDFTSEALPAGVYEDCSFTGCNFEGVNLSGISFTGCTFTQCNLSLAKLGGTAFRETVFINCKMLGLHFEHCRDINFTVSFQHCILNLSSFYQRKMKETNFSGCTLNETDFTEADISGAVFEHCDLSGAVFDNTILEKADLRSAYNYQINPAKNRVKKARFSATGIAGLLQSWDISIE